MKKRHFINISIGIAGLFLFISLSFSVKSQDPETYDPYKKFPIEQLKEDFKILRLALDEGHGGLHRYTKKEDLDKHFDSIYHSLESPLNEIQFYRKLLPLIAAINDGHTRISMSTAFRKHMEQQPNLIPFKFVFIKQKPYILRNYSTNPDLNLGSEVISINEQPIDKIINAMLKIIPSDAHIQTSKFRKLESPVLFSDLYNILFTPASTFVLVLKLDQEKTLKKITVKGLTERQLTSAAKERYPDDFQNDPPISLDYRDTIPVLTIKTFGAGGYSRSKISFPDFIKTAFTELTEKKVKNLIIDLRNNSGGSDEYGKILAAYFMEKSFLYYKSLEVKNTKFSFLDYTNIPDNRREMPSSRFRKNERGWYDALGHPNLGEQMPLEPTFQGRVYILINGNSFSATGECTSIIHFHKKAVFIGEECGAGYYGNTSGFMPILTLPNTGIRINIPLVRYTMAVEGYPQDRGIIPDYPVEQTIHDLLNSRDSSLEFTLELIKKSLE